MVSNIRIAAAAVAAHQQPGTKLWIVLSTFVIAFYWYISRGKFRKCAPNTDVCRERARRTESIVHYAYGLVYLKYNMYNALDAIKSNTRDGRDTRDDCCTLYLLTLLIRNSSAFMSMNYIRKFVRTTLHSNDSQDAHRLKCLCLSIEQKPDINHVPTRREGCIVHAYNCVLEYNGTGSDWCLGIKCVCLIWLYLRIIE